MIKELDPDTVAIKSDEIAEATRAFQKLSKEARLAAKNLSLDEARLVLGNYYRHQRDRMRFDRQTDHLSERGAPHAVITYLGDAAAHMEEEIKGVLSKWALVHPASRWAMMNSGIGPLIAVSLVAFIDPEKTLTTPKLWRYAGLDPTCKWEPGQLRPWNDSLKVLAWKIGQSFVKVSARDEAFYAHRLLYRKAYEWRRNLRGGNAEQAAFLAQKYGKDTLAYRWVTGQFSADAATEGLKNLAIGKMVGARKWAWSDLEPDCKVGEGMAMLSPGHIQQRSERYATKLFLSHAHTVIFYLHHGKLPESPWILKGDTGHRDFIAPPYRDEIPGLDKAIKDYYRAPYRIEEVSYDLILEGADMFDLLGL